VGNILHADMPRLDENIDTLKRLIPEPCLGIVPRLSDIAPNQVATYVSLPKQR
jgi:dethiobiotin synthetase